MRKIYMFDTTLRDGEQSPGVNLNTQEKVEIALQLEKLGIDRIEAGFPIASPGDLAAVNAVARAVKNASVTGLARSREKDIDAVVEALKGAQDPRIHIFLATSPIHRKHKLRMEKHEVLETAEAMIKYAKKHFSQVEFSAEDAGRTEMDFLVEVTALAVKLGVSVVNLPDTVGYLSPYEYGNIFKTMKEQVPGIEKVQLSAHCHDDLGLATANALAAIQNGADQIEGTINGIGERAGNTALEEVALALYTRGEFFQATTGLNLQEIAKTSRLVSKLTGMPVPGNKAIVGANAFAHESGIHQHGMLKHRGTYEIMRPQDVGLAETKLVLGKHSGRAALRQRLQALGHAPEEAALDAIFARFKTLADKKREVHDEDLEALALGQDPDALGPWRLLRLDTSTHLGAGASAAVKLRHDDGREAAEAAIGDGPVDAVLRAIERATDSDLRLADFQVRAVSEGGDAQGQARLVAHHAGRQWNGAGVSTDIVEATAQAALAIVNRIERQAASNPPDVTRTRAHKETAA